MKEVDNKKIYIFNLTFQSCILCIITCFIKKTRKYPLHGYILGMLKHITAWDRLWGGEVVLKLYNYTQPAKLDLIKKSLPKQKTIQNFPIDAQVFRKIKNENLPTWEIGVTS